MGSGNSSEDLKHLHAGGPSSIRGTHGLLTATELLLGSMTNEQSQNIMSVIQKCFKDKNKRGNNL